MGAKVTGKLTADKGGKLIGQFFIITNRISPNRGEMDVRDGL